ncbi:MAG: uncharacterized protein JWR68_1824 [Polaromonas sp.]|nr:uncharacterized protein [Polaromonas sp.]
MKLAIMQPYFFPYIGYFQLVNAVDKFVFYDDVNYIKSGWINRNRLFLSGAIRYITVPLSAASSFEKINRTRIRLGNEWAKQMLSVIHQSYAKAPHYQAVAMLVESVLNSHDGYVSTLARNSVIAVMNYLEIDKDFCISSTIYKNQELRSVDRVIDICKREKASQYWNLPGGRDLYHFNVFKNEGIDLRFVDVEIAPYSQMHREFQPGLSIIDILMFCDKLKIRKMMELHSE